MRTRCAYFSKGSEPVVYRGVVFIHPPVVGPKRRQSRRKKDIRIIITSGLIQFPFRKILWTPTDYLFSVSFSDSPT